MDNPTVGRGFLSQQRQPFPHQLQVKEGLSGVYRYLGLSDFLADPLSLTSQQHHFRRLEVDDLGDPVQVIGDRLAAMRTLRPGLTGWFGC